MSTALVKRSLQLLEESDHHTENKTTKKSKRNTGDIRKSIPIQIEKLKQSIARKNQVNVKKNAKLLLKKDRANQGKSSVDILNRLTQKSVPVEQKRKKNKKKNKQQSGSVFTEEDFARLAAELGT